MFNRNINFINKLAKKNKTNFNKTSKIYRNIIKEKSQIILSLSKEYKDTFSNKIIKKWKSEGNRHSQSIDGQQRCLLHAKSTAVSGRQYLGFFSRKDLHFM